VNRIHQFGLIPYLKRWIYHMISCDSVAPTLSSRDVPANRDGRSIQQCDMPDQQLRQLRPNVRSMMQLWPQRRTQRVIIKSRDLQPETPNTPKRFQGSSHCNLVHFRNRGSSAVFSVCLKSKGHSLLEYAASSVNATPKVPRKFDPKSSHGTDSLHCGPLAKLVGNN
jgi:hypothetical protein